MMAQALTKSQLWFDDACAGTGHVIQIFFQSLWWSRSAPRKKHEILNFMHSATFGSLLVVFIVALFTGMILGLQAGIVLSRYGQESKIGFIVSASMCREMGPVMTAFALTAMVGSTIAAEIGTMKVSEEIDALEVMSINPVYYLAMPRVLSMAVILPVLTIYTNVIGILGGGAVGKFILNIDFQTYINNARDALALRDIYSGLLKASVFGILIACVACSQGFRTEQGAEGVGKATMKTVTIAFIFTLIFNFFITYAIY